MPCTIHRWRINLLRTACSRSNKNLEGSGYDPRKRRAALYAWLHCYTAVRR